MMAAISFSTLSGPSAVMLARSIIIVFAFKFMHAPHRIEYEHERDEGENPNGYFLHIRVSHEMTVPAGRLSSM